MPSVSAAAGTQQQLRLEAEPVATTFSAADTTAFLQASWKKAMGMIVDCIVIVTVSCEMFLFCWTHFRCLSSIMVRKTPMK